MSAQIPKAVIEISSYLHSLWSIDISEELKVFIGAEYVDAIR
jgi:hypothetical protein